MKLVREHINEKFTDESDPIKDMGIGMRSKWEHILNKWDDECETCDCIFDRYFRKYCNKIDSVYETEIVRLVFNTVDKMLKNKSLTQQESFDITFKEEVKDSEDDDIFYPVFRIRRTVARILEAIFKIKVDPKLSKSVNEKFTADSDPIHDMNIGIKTLIKNWFLLIGVQEFSYKKYVRITRKGEINLLSGITLQDKINGNLPEFIKFNRVSGNFNVGSCNLTTLRGCPNFVGRDFTCNYNKLTSLEYSPKIVRGMYDCSYNKIKFTKEDVRKVCKAKDMIFV